LWSAPGGRAGVLLGFVALSMAGCAASDGSRPAWLGLHSTVASAIREVDLRPRFPRKVRTGPTSNSSSGSAAETYYGEDDPTAPLAPPRVGARNTGTNSGPAVTGSLAAATSSDSTNKGYEINFENTPIPTVAKAVLGDILGVGYTIDPRVQGGVTLSSGRAIPKKDLLFVLDSALRVSNVALVRNGPEYRLVPIADAAGTGSIDRTETAEAGYGISVIPLQFVSAPTLIKLLENFAARPGMVRAEPSRNLLIIQGNGAERRAAIENVLSFDADWMRGQSVGIYPLNNSTPEPVVAELERIIDAGKNGLNHNLVKLQPIGRRNAILVVTRKRELLKRVAAWITRLDRSASAGTGVKVYRMRYGDARQVAALLNDIFLGGSTSGLDSATNQLIPGGGTIASSSGRSGPGGSQPTLATAAAATVPSTSTATGFNRRFADAAGAQFAQNTARLAGATARRGEAVGVGAAPPGTGSLLPNVRIAPDVVNNALLIYANQENYRVIERALRQIDRPQLQVAIDATIAEITLNDELRYGVQFFLKSQDVGLGHDKGSALNTISSAASSALLERVLPGFNFFMGSEADPRMILDALRTVTNVKVLSTPSVVVVDNQFASLQVGDQIPITTRTAQAVDVPTAPVVNNIDYRNTGVILRVAPRINANGNVLLDIEQEISAVAKTPSAGTLTPTVSQRRVRSSIAVASGQTVLLAGLISERQDRGRQGIPGLEQIPGIGELFSHNDGTIQRTELIIFIRPQIIRNGIDAARVARELRGKMVEFQRHAPERRPAIHGKPAGLW
jgi:general secretion pathway protein D